MSDNPGKNAAQLAEVAFAGTFHNVEGRKNAITKTYQRLQVLLDKNLIYRTRRTGLGYCYYTMGQKPEDE